MLVGSSYLDRQQVQFSFGDISILGEDIQDTDNEAATEAVDIFKKVQSVLKYLPAKGQEKVVLKATVKTLVDNSMALVISVSYCQARIYLFDMNVCFLSTNNFVATIYMSFCVSADISCYLPGIINYQLYTFNLVARRVGNKQESGRKC